LIYPIFGGEKNSVEATKNVKKKLFLDFVVIIFVEPRNQQRKQRLVFEAFAFRARD